MPRSIATERESVHIVSKPTRATGKPLGSADSAIVADVSTRIREGSWASAPSNPFVTKTEMICSRMWLSEILPDCQSEFSAKSGHASGVPSVSVGLACSRKRASTSGAMRPDGSADVMARHRLC